MTTPISFPSTTARFGLPFLFAGQAQKEFFVNQSLLLLDSLAQLIVEDAQNAPPAQPENGMCFRVSATGMEEWSGHDDSIAIRIADAWHFVPPEDGMKIYDRTAQQSFFYSNGWASASAPLAPAGGSTIDTEARAAIEEIIQALRATTILPPNI